MLTVGSLGVAKNKGAGPATRKVLGQNTETIATFIRFEIFIAVRRQKYLSVQIQALVFPRTLEENTFLQTASKSKLVHADLTAARVVYTDRAGHAGLQLICDC